MCDPQPKEVVRVRIGARLFDRALVQRAFRYLPDEEVLWHEGLDARASLVTGEGWRMLLMPLRDEGNFGDVPRLALGEVSRVA